MKLGFQFVPFPREIWEKPIQLSGQEFRLLGWFLSDLRFGVEVSTYTDKQILTGCNYKPGVGLSRNAFKQARDLLVSKGLLQACPHDGCWNYRLSVSITDTAVSITDTETEKSVSITDTAIKEVRDKNRNKNIELTFIRPPRSSRIPVDFVVTDQHRLWASSKNLPSPDSLIDQFRDYWTSKSGQGATKCDWDATFRNWIRNPMNSKGNGNARKQSQIDAIRNSREFPSFE